MFKKVLLTSAVMAIVSQAAFANAAPAAYIGAGLGIQVNTGEYTNHSGNDIVLGNRLAPVNVFAGYGGQVFQNIYVAGELTGTIGTIKVSDTGWIKSTYSYGASILPGIMLSDSTLAFVRAGVVRTEFSSKNFSTSGQQLTGGIFGFGMQTSLTQNVDLRGEYDFTAYHGQLGIVSPRSDAATVSLIYKFN